jgi:hypothetical protein
MLCESLELNENVAGFEEGLTLEPYMHKMKLEKWQISRAKGVVAYVIHDLNQKSQPGNTQIFTPQLEPIMELFRLLSYEWNKKLTRLNLARDHMTAVTEINSVEGWFHGLAPFCLSSMRKYLAIYKQGKLSLNNLEGFRQQLFDDITEYYSQLPAHLSQLETYEEHAKALDYINSAELAEEDEYWMGRIPA